MIEYLKFTAVLLFVTIASYFVAQLDGLSVSSYMQSFMGVFFLVFASFKVYNLKEFALGFQSYYGMQDKPLSWGYSYPFIQIIFGVLYLVGAGESWWFNLIVFAWSAYSTYIVWLTLRNKGDVHCVCLGNVIKLPLSRISFVEDFGMAIMAAAMIFI